MLSDNFGNSQNDINSDNLEQVNFNLTKECFACKTKERNTSYVYTNAKLINNY